MTTPFKVKAVYEYTSPHEDDLHFPSGQIITVTEEEDDDWYVGEYVDASGTKQEGIFPRNFVEKYEPTAPPRPVRASRPKKEPEPAPVPVTEPAPAPAPEPEQTEPEAQSQPTAREPSPEPPAVSSIPAPKAAPVSPPAAPKPAPAVSKSIPPPVSEKPSGGSFKDRIAAFNKAAPPVAPFKPGGLSSQGANSFIKKPFVAPPPSRNAYVPPPRETTVAKTYRRDEDPEIAAREAENQEQAEKAGLAASSNDADAEDQPKPTSLKERIALLQKQQAEQAARHAEAAQKKEKPKRPVKKRTESHSTIEGAEEGEGAVGERQDTEEPAGKASMDSLREERDAPRRRKYSRDAGPIPGIPPKGPFIDGNDADMSGAGYTTEEPEEMATIRDDSDEKPVTKGPPPRAPAAPAREPDVGEEEGTSEEPAAEDEEEGEEAEEEDDIDPEVRRKEELRARMAKMSGGMGMHGMFGPPGGMPMPGMVPPKKKKSTGASEARSTGHEADDVPTASTRAPPVPMIPLPGLSQVRSPEEVDKRLEEDEDETPIARTRPTADISNTEDVVQERNAPPVPGGRPAPPPVPKESRPVPPPPKLATNPSVGSESDDEMSESTQNLSSVTPTAEAPRPPARPSEGPGSPPPPTPKRPVPSEQAAPTSPPPPGLNREKRSSRVPPIPGAAAPAAAPVPFNRAPPPPPPAAPLTRSATGDRHNLPPKIPTQIPSDEEEITEYEGDVDTDIASGASHKDALRAHARDSSFDDSSLGRTPMSSPPAVPPPLPSAPAPRGIPPPLPSQPPPNVRRSSEVPRAAPPPPPPAKIPAPWEQENDEYDPFKYTAPAAPSYSSPAPKPTTKEDDLYSTSPPRTFVPTPVLPPQERVAPRPPPREPAPAASSRAPHRQSSDANRSAAPPIRRSTDLARMSMEAGFVANDVDLGRNSFWWTQPKTIPPVFQGRRDILYESEESTSSTRDGKSSVIKDVYIIFQDYSQTIIRAEFSAQDPADINLEQRHEPPPSRLRQDQLEDAHEQFGRLIHEAVSAKRETTVGDGTPHGLIQELLRPYADALPPVGTRAYGAVVYGNLANASTQQNDEIRPGDILTFRNARFQGKHGAMHAKYSMEVGKPDHVAVVAEWDGTKKKVRAWEQGRESKKVKLESFKLDDLRSGEVKIWRVMPRSWVGWTSRS